MAYSVTLPHITHALDPADGMLIKINDVAADIRLVIRIKACGDTAEEKRGGSVHFQCAEPAVGKVTQHAHAGMVESQRHVQHDGGVMLFAKGTAGLHENVPGPGKDELLRVNAVRLCHLKRYKYVLYRLLEAYGFRDRLLEPVVRLLESGKTFSGKVFEAPGYELITAGECLIVRKAARVVPDSSVVSERADAHGDRSNLQGDLRSAVTVGTPVGVQGGKRGSVMVGKWGGTQNGAQVDKQRSTLGGDQVDKQGGTPGGAQVDEQGGESSPVVSENHGLGECFGLAGRDSASITSSFVGAGLSYSGLAGRGSARRSRGTLTTGGTVINENETCSVVRTTGEYVFDDFRVNVSVSEAGADPVADAKSLAREGVAAFSSEALTLPFLLRGWQNGDWMRPVGLNGKKKLSDIFTGLRLSIEEKSRALVIVLPGSASEGAGCGDSSSDVSDSDASRRGTDKIGTDAVCGVRVAGVCGYVSGRFFFRVDESVMVTPATASILKLYLRALENV